MDRRILFIFALLLWAAPVLAHPVLENRMDVVVARDQVTLSAKIVLVEVDVAHPVGIARGPVEAGKLKSALDEHAGYLLSHLHVMADGKSIVGTLKSITPPSGEVKWEDFEEKFATYELSYPLATPPAKVRIEEDLLKEFSRLGQTWQVLFVVQSRVEPQSEWTQAAVLSQDQPLEIACNWGAGSRGTGSAWHTALSYTRHGLMHILTGYDHLLFVAGLVLGAAKLWDLVKVVTAFAIAHTLTLTLSVMNLVHVSSSIVEPMIAASIVFVALQNVFFPKQARGPTRWLVAFGFGLFHGLGFAGGLLDAMQGMPAVNLAVALIAFTFGVELAHQLLIVPLYFVVKWIRRAPAESSLVLPMPLPLRLASIAISIAGMYYFLGALGALHFSASSG